MHYIKKNKITGMPCKYKLSMYFMEYDSKELSKNASVMIYGLYQKTSELELNYLLKELFLISTESKYFKVHKPTFKSDGTKHNGKNNLKKAIVYDTYEDRPLLQLDYWKIKLVKDVLYNNIPVVPPEKLYINLDPQQKQDFRSFYRCFGWLREEVKIGNTYKKQWTNDYMILNDKTAAI